ncbi:MAG: hypothetical protein AB1921_00425 [Thermodesulfobacteriota bacterium]
MYIHDFILLAGLILWGAAALGTSVVGVRNNGFLGPRRSVLSDLGPADMKIVKLSGASFLLGLLLIIAGLLFL